MYLLLLASFVAAEPALVMEPEDGRCLPGEEILLGVEQPDTGSPWSCQWTIDDELGEGLSEEELHADSVMLSCPGCKGRPADRLFTLHSYCTDVDNNAYWDFDEVVLACSEIVNDPVQTGCGCSSSTHTALWATLLALGIALVRGRER